MLIYIHVHINIHVVSVCGMLQLSVYITCTIKHLFLRGVRQFQGGRGPAPPEITLIAVCVDVCRPTGGRLEGVGSGGERGAGKSRTAAKVEGQYPISYIQHTHTCTVRDGTYRVILRIVKAGGHPVAIAQVVEH